ncbi:MAG: signal peptidase II [Cyanobacteria bacterium SIG31]|nr:signal peptidase II [Cyanobacteria bacterium SIG31]
MTKLSKMIYFFISVIFLTVFDLYFSELILNKLRFSYNSNPILDLIFVQNTGAAFSILEDYKYFLILFAIIAIFIILNYTAKHVEKFSTLSVFWAAMLVSGISCNLYERIAFGYVRDFFKLNFIDFPVFNISDIFINVGVLAIIVIIIKNKYLKK